MSRHHARCAAAGRLDHPPRGGGGGCLGRRGGSTAAAHDGDIQRKAPRIPRWYRLSACGIVSRRLGVREVMRVIKKTWPQATQQQHSAGGKRLWRSPSTLSPLLVPHFSSNAARNQETSSEDSLITHAHSRPTANFQFDRGSVVNRRCRRSITRTAQPPPHQLPRKPPQPTPQPPALVCHRPPFAAPRADALISGAKKSSCLLH